MCSSIEQQQSAIPPSIVPDQNSFIHLCWDNFDLTEETPSGAGTTHTAHGIVIQEMFTSADSDACSDQQSLPKDKKTLCNSCSPCDRAILYKEKGRAKSDCFKHNC